MAIKYICLLIVAYLFGPVQAIDATASRMDGQQELYELLQSGDSATVRALPVGDREIFMATIAMNQGRIRTALVFLNAERVKKNRLAALIRAEAYRRQSVQAAVRAGHYAHAVNDDISKLKKVQISSGLDEANKRLDVFVVSLNEAKLAMSKASMPTRHFFERGLPEQENPVQTAQLTRPENQFETESKANMISLSRPVRESFPPIVVQRKPTQRTLKLAKLKQPEFAPPEENITNMDPVPAPMPARPIKAVQKKVVAGFVRELAKPVKIVPTITIVESVTKAIEAWREDWQSRDSQAYLSHYHKSFKTLKHDYNSWATYKQRVNGKKSFIQVDISQLKVMPSSELSQAGEAALVTFKQHYKSSNYNEVSYKQLYMARKNMGEPWLILYEGDEN